MRCAEVGQHARHFDVDLRWRREQHVRVDVALQRLAVGPFADQGAGTGEVHRPVESEHVAIQCAHGVQPQPAALGEHQSRHRLTIGAVAFQLRQHARGVGQAELVKGRIGQHAAPAVENHHGLRTGIDLRIEVGRHGVGVDGQDLVHQVRAAVEQRLDLPVIAGTRALDHVAGQRPRTARKADQRHAAIERAANRRHRVEHVLELVHVGHFECLDGRLVAQRSRKTRTFAGFERQAQAHGVGHGQDVGKQDGGIERVAGQGLQRDLGRVVDIGCQPHEAACPGARGDVLRQVAPGLAHQPDRGVRSRLAKAGTKEGVVFQGGKRSEGHRAIVAGGRHGGMTACH